MSRKTHFHISIDVEDLAEVERFVADPKTPVTTMSECFREMTKFGMQTFHYTETMKDPEKAAEFEKQMGLLLKHSNMDEWIQAQSESDLANASHRINLERKARYEQRSLV